jgi:outer membrane receptor protein involved in Fe transport
VLWDVDPTWQVFGNISRSAEVPTFDANKFTSPVTSNADAQTATTYEIGTRGRRPNITWDLALYRAEIRNELQCLRTSPYGLCTVVNADRTVHQGVEAGLGVAFLKSAFVQENRFWLISPTPTTTSSSTPTRAGATTVSWRVAATSSAPRCATSIRAVSMPVRTSILTRC